MGDFVSGLPHGKRIIASSTGVVYYNGAFECGNRCGAGFERFRNGKVYNFVHK
jgi:hypothetical protein